MLHKSAQYWFCSCLLAASSAFNIAYAQIDLTATYPFSLQAHSLSDALQQLSKQAHITVQLEKDIPQIHKNIHFNRSATLPAVLNEMLDGTGFSWKLDANDQILISTVNKGAPIKTPDMLITAQIDEYQSSMTINRELIERMPSGNGDITSMLKLNPHVQFDDKQLSSFTPGEINPANISINGAKFYQNAFVVDGFNMNNDLDPGRSQHHLLDAVPGQSQGMALDIDLLEEITVHDSNVSAAYGHFNGGVVETKTRKPKADGLHGKFSMQTTMDAWTQYHVHKSQEDAFENSGSDSMQPKFTKLTIRGTLEGYLTDNFGMIGSFDRKLSTIPLSLYSANNVDTMGYYEEKQHRKIDNYFLKSMWQASDHLSIDSTITYAPSTSSYFRANSVNSGYDIKNGGMQLGTTWRWDGDWAIYEHGVLYGALEQSRRSESDDWFTWQKSETKPWGIGNKPSTMSLEGGYGNVDQKQKSWQYKFDMKLHPIAFANTTHRIRAGLDFSWKKYNYERVTESNTYVMAKSTNTCIRSDGTLDNACSMGTTIKGFPGQYLSQRTSFKQGEFSFSTRELGAYIEDDMSFGRFSVRPGLRIDNDSFMQKTTVAPRLSMQFDVFDDSSSVITAGVNRYYGRSIAAWGLEDGRNRLRFTERRTDINSPWQATAHAPNNSLFQKLDVPYDDELMLGFKQSMGWADIGIKVVQREGKKQVIEVTGKRAGVEPTDPNLAKNFKVYTNNGQSKDRILSITAQNNQLLDFAGMQHNVLVALDFRQSKRSAPSYREEGLSDYDSERYQDNPYISYKGSVIRYRDRPAANYNRPWTLRANLISYIEPLDLTVTNFFRLRDGYTQIVKTSEKMEYQGTPIDVYEEKHYSKAFTWDMRLGWEKYLAQDQSVFINVDINNLLNARSVMGNTSGLNSVETYEIGRQFWLEVGYKF
ncbi:TonB-dependent receptor plug domain-containing protein [Pseudomonas sp. F1_0610]|uniref:TonB-dependent receptor plug domain-containing protein n=1 Tax=Pseudomonas sp. F1_0610 TaxID=3114284 RepID=UPI0039C176A4